ncbi:MAG: glycosyltransferase family 87 protein [Spirosomataceae bacterium]
MKQLLRSYPFECFVAFACLVVLVIETINERLWMNDFKVYYFAAQHLIGDGQVYGQPFGLGSGFFKYSPFAALCFVPVSQLPYEIAKHVHYVLSSVATICMFLLLKQLFREAYKAAPKQFNWMLVGILAVNSPQLFRELHLGNVNMMLLLLNLLALLRLPKQPYVAGSLIGLCLLFKPHFVLLLPLLVLHKQIKALVACTAAIGVGLLLPAVLIGWSQNLQLLTEWMQAIRQHNDSLDSARDNLAYIIQYYTVHNQSIDLYKQLAIGVLAGFILLMGIVRFRHWQIERNGSSILAWQHLKIEAYILLASIPTLLITDTEHFLLSIPLITFLVLNALHYRLRKPLYLLMLFVALALFWGSDFVSDNAMLGMGNALLLLLIAGHESLSEQLSSSS